jgi:hypothetical protein
VPARPAAHAPPGDGTGHEAPGHETPAYETPGDEAIGYEAPGYEAIGYDGGSAIPAGFGLAVISGLAEDVRVLSTSSGVSIRMSWPSAASSS